MASTKPSFGKPLRRAQTVSGHSVSDDTNIVYIFLAVYDLRKVTQTFRSHFETSDIAVRFHRDDRLNSAGGGTVVAVRTSIGHHRVNLLHRGYLEGTTVEIHGALSGVFVVVAY